MNRTIIITILSLLLSNVSIAGERTLKKDRYRLNILGTPTATLSNINRIASWYQANGVQERQPLTGNSGFTYPRSTAQAIYASGIVWGGKFIDGSTPSLRVNGQVYNAGTKPGRILGIGTGLSEDPAAPEVRIWRVRKDMATATFNQDAAEFFNVSPGSVTQQMIDSIRSMYFRDWSEWPWMKGAPFYDQGYLAPNGVDTVGAANGFLDWGEDANRNSILDPGEDANLNGSLDGETPGIAGADQVVWFVCNDIGVAQPYGSPESGIEQQTAIWGYARTDPLGNAVFKRIRLFYKGGASTPSTANIDSMYIAVWSDPDIGDSGDDFSACDSARQLGYCYNAGPTDADYQTYGLVPPAAGHDLLQGPLVFTGNPSDTGFFNFRKIPRAKNLPMTSFLYFAAGGTYSDPPFNYSGTVQWYQMLRGLPPTPVGPPDPPPLINPTTGQPTTFWLSGDPVTGTGWLDGTIDNPGDRRIVLSTGPFTMALGDSQEIVVATIAGLGSSHINSISVLRFYENAIQQWYLGLINPVVDVEDEVYDLPERFVLSQNYPNPFNPTTTLSFDLPEPSIVSLVVYDVLGRKIAELAEGSYGAGTHTAIWNAEQRASGVYFARFVVTSSSGEVKYSKVNKLVLMK